MDFLRPATEAIMDSEKGVEDGEEDETGQCSKQVPRETTTHSSHHQIQAPIKLARSHLNSAEPSNLPPPGPLFPLPIVPPP